jgi:hypothetical protein
MLMETQMPQTPQQIKPLHITLKEQDEKLLAMEANIATLMEGMNRLISIIVPPTEPINPIETQVKTPEELKVEIEKMVDDAFKKAEVIDSETL